MKQRILAHPGSNSAELARSAAGLQDLWLEVVQLTGEDYRPRYAL